MSLISLLWQDWFTMETAASDPKVQQIPTCLQQTAFQLDSSICTTIMIVMVKS